MRTETRRSAPSSIRDSMPVPQPLKSKRASGRKPATNAKTTTSPVHQYKMTFQRHYATPETRQKTLKRPRQFTNTKWHSGQKRYATPETPRETLKQRPRLFTIPIQNDIPKTLCHAGNPTKNAKTTSSVHQYKMTFRPKTLCHAGNPTRNAKTTTSSVHQYKMTSRPKTLCHPGKTAGKAKTTTSSVQQCKMTFQKHYTTPLQIFHELHNN